MIQAKTAVVWDLDGCLADNSHRADLAPIDVTTATQDDWAAWSLECRGDKPIAGAVRRMMWDWPAHQVHICSSRGSAAAAGTRWWLDQHAGGFWDYLRLRQAGDCRPGWQLKVEYILALAQSVPVVLAYEDLKPEAEKIFELTDVPVLLVNPAYTWVEKLRGEAGAARAQ